MKSILFNVAIISAVLCLGFVACKPKEIRTLAETGSALGAVLAEETIKAAGTAKSVVVITQTRSDGSESSAESAFKKSLEKSGVKIIATVSPNLGDPMRYGEFGWKATDFAEMLGKYPQAGAIVSFIGAPLLKPAQFSSVPATHPSVLVVAVSMLGETPGITGDRAMLPYLLDAKIVQLAIVDGAGTDAGKSDDAHETFSKHYQILRSAKAP